MKKLLGWVSVVASTFAVAANIEIGLPKILALLLVLVFVPDPILQVIIALVLAFLPIAVGIF
ncbi:MAG: hypothetical protein HY650_12490 [Acidobacteria bacterium]|nr:hypothetical protein [Acidobacteriota bacterium]